MSMIDLAIMRKPRMIADPQRSTFAPKSTVYRELRLAGVIDNASPQP